MEQGDHQLYVPAALGGLGGVWDLWCCFPVGPQLENKSLHSITRELHHESVRMQPRSAAVLGEMMNCAGSCSSL